MFYITEIEDHVRVDPKLFGLETLDAVEQQLKETYKDYMDKIKEFSECLRYATEDFDSAEILFNQYRKPINVICYHCQQAAEKCLKGFLVSRGVEFERTHDLLRIIDECIKIEESFSAIVRYCMKLNPYSVITRYPSELELR